MNQLNPKNVLIVGGGGYVGTKLSGCLAAKNYTVTVFDTFWFGDFVQRSPNLNVVKGDVRDEQAVRAVMAGKDAVVLLACLSNDPMSDIDPELTRDINLKALQKVVAIAKASGVKRLVYASSMSVYGVQDVPKVTEDVPLRPITLYSKYKVEMEEVVRHAADDNFAVVNVRSSTVCGYSPRMRLDLLVNLFVWLAMKNGVIFLEGGDQIRPLIHIDDLVDFYVLMLTADRDKIHDDVYNISSGNYTVKEVAEMVRRHVPCELKQAKVVDGRSYPGNADKALEKLGFKTKRTVEQALVEVKEAIASGKINGDDVRCFNLKWLKELMKQDAKLVNV